MVHMQSCLRHIDFIFLKIYFYLSSLLFFLQMLLFMISLMSLFTSHDLSSTFYKSCYQSQLYTYIFWVLLSCLKPFNFVSVRPIFLLQLNFPWSALILSSLLFLPLVQPILCSFQTICHILKACYWFLTPVNSSKSCVRQILNRSWMYGRWVVNDII